MRRSTRVLTLALVTCVPAAALAPAIAAEPGLAGTWTVDLSTTPGAPYTKPMRLELRDDGAVAGSFYDSAIEAGRWKQDRGRLCASFRTTDGQGPYHSAVCLAGDEAVGQTWAEHRDFLFNWRAVRDAP